jgi:hypothetical protein
VIATRAALQNANGFATDLQSAEDWGLWLKLANRGKVAVSNAVTMNYLMRPNGETQNRPGRIAAMKGIIAPYETRDDPGTRRACKAARARINIAEAEYMRLSGAYWSAAKAHFGAFVSNPKKRTARAALSDVAHGLFAW